MSGPCGVGPASPPGRLWRNGMDFVPKKTYPPDYSNVPSVRDWQMSPFGNERYDLDEIQRAEKKGFKGRFELQRLKALYGGGGGRFERKKSECTICAERKAKEKKRACPRATGEYLYQPYGPSLASSLSYARPHGNRTTPYSCLGPSTYACYRFGVPKPIVPCPDHEDRVPRVLNGVYVPYGPHGKYRITPGMYIPMGPSTYPLL